MQLILSTLHMLCTEQNVHKLMRMWQTKTFTSLPNPFHRTFQVHNTSVYAANKNICQFAKPVPSRVPSTTLARMHQTFANWLVCKRITVKAYQ